MKPDPHIEPLISDYFAGTLDQESMDRLERWLLEDDSRIDLLVRYATIEQGLVTVSHHDMASNLMSALAEDESEEYKREGELPSQVMPGLGSGRAFEPVKLADAVPEVRDEDQLHEDRGTRIFKFPLALVYAAAAACLLLGVFVVIYSLPTSGTNQPPAYTDDLQADPDVPLNPMVASATILNTFDAVWEIAPQQGQVKPNGPVRLIKGYAELEFDDGARVVLQGPVSFEPMGSNAVRLFSGRLTATVPQSAHGFKVYTPTLVITDVGTAFGVDVAESGEVITAVLKGEILVDDNHGSPSITMVEGQFIEADAAGQLGHVSLLPASVSASLFAKTLEDAVAPHSRYSRSVLDDQPLLYWRFEELAQSRVTNSEGTPRGDGVMWGGVQQAEGVVGRGVRFNGAMQNTGGIESLGSPLVGDEKAYTIELWAKPDRIQHACLAALLRKPPRGEKWFLHQGFVEILSDGKWLEGQPAKQNALRFLHRSPMSGYIEDGQNLWDTPVYKPGQWMMLTAVKSEQHIALYLNGELVAQAVDDQDVSGPVQFLLGSAGVGAGLNEWNVRPFAGVIDEVAVYGYALSADSIATRYELGIENLQAND